MVTEPLARYLTRLHQASQRWLERRGYIIITIDKGETVIEITEEGHKYFNKIGWK